MTQSILYLILTLYATWMLSLAYGLLRSLRKNFPQESGALPLPAVTVVIAARNEEQRLPDLLNTLQLQTTEEGSFEVIVVDDRSTDGTATLVKQFNSTFPLTLLSLTDHNSASGKKAALSLGIAAARNPLILVTDADCTVKTGWVISFRRLFAISGCKMAAGLVSMGNISTMAQKTEALDFYGLVAASAGAAGIHAPFMCNGANMAFLQQSFAEINGFAGHEHLSSGDDVFLLHQFIQHFGKESISWNLSTDSLVETRPNRTMAGFINQRLRWASKSKAYRHPWAIAIALVVLCVNAILVLSLISIPMTRDPDLPMVLLMIKFLGEFPLMILFLKHIKQTNLILWLLPSSLVYPFYTMGIGILSMFCKPDWKERKIK